MEISAATFPLKYLTLHPFGPSPALKKEMKNPKKSN